MQESERTQTNESEAPKEKSKEKKTAKRVLRIAASIALALLLFFAGWLGHWLSLGERAQSLLWAIGTAEKNFYRGIDGEFYEDLFSAFSLDPYSQYYTKEEYEAVLRASRGEHADFGFSVGTRDGAPCVYRITGNSPAERAGLLAGMRIFRFGEDPASMEEGDASDIHLALQELDSLYLEAGFGKEEEAELYFVERKEYREAECLYRDGETALRFLSGEKEPYHAPIGALGILPENTAYLRIDRFYASANTEFEAALSYMYAHGKRDLVIDLRQNGGGYLSVFQAIAGHLLKDAKESRPVVAVARYGNGREELFRAPCNDYAARFPEGANLYVLADENTASASECLIGALVSYGLPFSNIYLRAGSDARTYGKGIMQSYYTDPHGNVLKLTSAEIFWPSGKSIHGVGVTAEDGAVPIEAPLLPGAEDEFLVKFCALLGS